MKINELIKKKINNNKIFEMFLGSRRGISMDFQNLAYPMINVSHTQRASKIKSYAASTLIEHHTKYHVL